MVLQLHVPQIALILGTSVRRSDQERSLGKKEVQLEETHCRPWQVDSHQVCWLIAGQVSATPTDTQEEIRTAGDCQSVNDFTANFI